MATRLRSWASSEAGHASLETMWALPFFFVFLGALVVLGYAEVVSVRSAVTARHAAWHEARADQAVSVAMLRESIGVHDLRASSRHTAWWRTGLGGVDQFIPATGDLETTLEIRVAPPFRRLVRERTFMRRFAVIDDLWDTPPDREGLQGFFAKLLGGIPLGFEFL
jgi:hypothetical protein